MATMTGPEGTLDLRRDSEILGQEIARMQAELERIITVAGLTNDPTLPLLKILSASLRLQWRLHNQAVRYFHDASDRLDRAYHETIQKTDLAVRQAEAVLQTKQAGIVEQLAPKLASTVSYAAVQHAKIVKYKTLGIWSAIVLALGVAPCIFTYAAGLNAGRFQGEVATHLINVAMKASPAEATAWGQLMQDNDGVVAMAACRKSMQQDADGRHYCFMPVWTDPMSPAIPTASGQ
ncbi:MULTISPECIES: hypothetical protein [Acidocella]|uniref:Uncharacterized protein n=1 Tax=Acidocella aminolytica 101 = DSM 11237 TaxID=1120923 RepID=A0A0D6PGY5_9PROT|nr:MULTISPECIES: hypothetical protein [Acidocella]GAN80611.1 hypothetical protein Aam_054_032 [Acidocella aminolytica 101 = DSM 11237]GBQ43144.1 hypothetical protein AA11237_3195 [Acidocella aminolytica 101 = DSM 11237]SHF22321.1 hypothetical protein SAMN02746095_02505 [Acidocella aminolytica 101 = DSM 11237]